MFAQVTHVKLLRNSQLYFHTILKRVNLNKTQAANKFIYNLLIEMNTQQ